MASKNDITGDTIATKTTTDSYRDNWERIFSKDKERLKRLSEESERLNKEMEGTLGDGLD